MNIHSCLFFPPDSDSYRGFLLPIGGGGTRMPLQGAVGRGAIAGCHRRVPGVLWLSGRGCRCWVPLLGACRVPL